jgi:hypothetical protein
MKPKDKDSADWNLWADMEEVQLWQAVALSLDIEPNSLPGLNFRPIVGGPFDDCPDEFKRRLKLAVSKFYDANTEIRLSSLREWAEQLKNPWTFPEDFPQQQPPMKEAVKSAPIAVEQKEVTAKAAPMPLSVVSNSTKPKRRDSLTPVIEKAQATCRNANDTAEVWAALQVLAEKKQPPLRGATEDGLQYLKNGIAESFTRDALRKRLARQPPLSAAKRR